MFEISLNVSFGSVASATFCCRIFGFACRLIASVMLSILFVFFHAGRSLPRQVVVDGLVGNVLSRMTSTRCPSCDRMR